MAEGAQYTVTATPIPGLQLVTLPLHRDARGWFKENWQPDRMRAAGIPDFRPVQHNVAFNDAIGTTRGIHAEPWDKWVSVASGRVFAAWVDLREGPSFGTLFTAEIDPSRAAFVPRGVGNAYQTLERGTVYTYLVDDLWSADADYTHVDPADATLAVPWPIPLSHAVVSDKDRSHPALEAVDPIGPRMTLVVGASGQVGRALRATLGDASHIEYADRETLDIRDPGILTARRWRDYSTIINAAGFTSVDGAETPEGRREAWATNVGGATHLAQLAGQHDITLVHLSSDYVFDGDSDQPYSESDEVGPLSVYGQTKAAADKIVATVARHYIVRTSWVIGDGDNFVRTMLAFAERGVDPAVVDDEHGRPTFADELALGIRHLLASGAEHGTYNLSGDGPAATWARLARMVFEGAGHDPQRVTPVSAATYRETATRAVAIRPRNSLLALGKITSSGFSPEDWRIALTRYLSTERGFGATTAGPYSST
jgi:dTDP-4-dehydrorhamnose 3,5-epimerase